MTHDKYIITAVDQFRQCRGYNTGFYFRSLFDSLGCTAIEFKAAYRFNGGLVATAPERHIKRLTRHFLGLGKVFATTAYADG